MRPAPRTAPSPPWAKALQYLREQWPYLVRYLEDGRLELSNNRAERSIKPFVMGRKNWLFSNTPAGAQSSAVIYSLIETAKENDLDPYGRDIRLEEDGHFAPGGYVLNNGGQFIEHYHGIEDIPDEHKVFAFPQLTVREQMAAYKEIIDGSSLEAIGRLPQRNTRNDNGTSGRFVQRCFFHGKEGYG